MNKELKYRWRAEILLWLIVAVATFMIIYPVYQNTYNFPFLWVNTLFVVLALTFSRWIFFWRITPYENTMWVIVILVCIQPLLLFILIRLFGDFRLYLDEKGLFPVLTQQSMEESMRWAKIIKMEMIAFSVFVIISAITLFFRLIYQVRVIYKDK